MTRRLLTSAILSFSLSSLAGQAKYSFAIYLLENNAPELENMILAEKPILTDEHIVKYNWNTHSFVLSNEDVYHTIRPLNCSRQTARGPRGLLRRQFAVVANGVECYRGVFWSSFLSTSCASPIIDIDTTAVGKRGKNEIVIERAYPSARVAKGKDPRNDMRIYDVLRALGKIEAPPTSQSTGPNSLPSAAP